MWKQEWEKKNKRKRVSLRKECEKKNVRKRMREDEQKKEIWRRRMRGCVKKSEIEEKFKKKSMLEEREISMRGKEWEDNNDRSVWDNVRREIRKE